MQTLARYRWTLEPLAAVVLGGAWSIMVVPLGLTSLLLVVLACAAVAISRFSPLIALGVAWLAAFGELSGTGYIPAAIAWPGYIAIAITIFSVTAHGRATVGWLALASAVPLGAISALPGARAGFTVFQRATPIGVAGTETVTVALLGTALSIGLALAWVVGFLVARQRSVVLDGDRSLLLWLATPSSLAALPADGNLPTLVRPLKSWQLGVDIVLALLYLLICALDGASGIGVRLIVAIVFAVAIALRRLSPTAALGVAWLAAIIHMLSGTAVQPSDIAVLIVLYATAAYGDKITRWAGLVSVGIGSLLAATYLVLSNTLQVSAPGFGLARFGSIAAQFAIILVVALCILGVAWLLGLLVRTWQRAAESRRALGRAEREERVAREQTVVEQQRNRIARDMHDVVAHSLAVVIAQADGARYARHADPKSVDDALLAIASTARDALGDVRLLLAELRHNEVDGPQPGLADLDRLIDQLSAAGLAVVRTDSGSPRAIGAAAQLAVYRITQEALTNALRHGVAGDPVELTILWTSTGIAIRSVNRVPGQPAISGEAPGHGIPGMRERASLVGGTMDISCDQTTFTVNAFVPVPQVNAQPRTHHDKGAA